MNSINARFQDAYMLSTFQSRRWAPFVRVPKGLGALRIADTVEDRSKAKDYLDLHHQVDVRLYLSKYHLFYSVLPQASVNLLDNLETFLSTFQKDLAAVAGQISELQDRSKEIDAKLKSRKVFLQHAFFRMGLTRCIAIENRETVVELDF